MRSIYSANPYNAEYGSESNYWNQEALMGARWMIEDGKGCPCNGSGYLLTNIDTTIRCGCPLPWYVEATLESYLRDQYIDSLSVYYTHTKWGTWVEVREDPKDGEFWVHRVDLCDDEGAPYLSKMSYDVMREFLTSAGLAVFN